MLGMRCLMRCSDRSSLPELTCCSVVNRLLFHAALCSRAQAPAGETGRAGERSVRVKATTGNRDEGALRSHPADSLPKHSLPVPVTDGVPFSCCCAPQNEKTLAKACEKARTEKKKLQEDLAKSQEELLKLRDRLAEVETALQSTRQE